MKKVLFLLFCLTAFPWLKPSAETVPFNSYTLSVADGLPCNTINDIVQDKNGYMWIGTSEGLCRYDGYSFVNYSNTNIDALKNKDARIRQLFYDSRHHVIWICNSSFVYFCFDISKEKFVDKAGDNRSYQYALLNGSKLMLYDQDNGLRTLSYRNGDIVVKDYPQSKRMPEAMKRQTMLSATERRTALLCGMTGARMVARGGCGTFITNDKNELWLLGGRGARCIIKGLNTAFTKLRTDKFTIRQYSNGQVAIATYGDGLYLYDPSTGTTEHIITKNNQRLLQSDYIHNIYIDATDGLWLCAESAGLTHLSKFAGASAQYHFLIPNANSQWANSIRRIFNGKNGHLLISNKENQLFDFDTSNGHTRPVGTFTAMVYAYGNDAYGNTVVGTRGDGLYINGTRYSPLTKEHYIQSKNILDIATDNRRRLWVATAESGLLMGERQADGTFHFTQFLGRSLKDAFIHDLELNSAGTVLYAATNHGLYKVDVAGKTVTAGAFKTYNMDNGTFPVDEFICLRLTSGHTLWAGTLGGGAMRCSLDGSGNIQKVKSFGISGGLESNNIRAIEQDRMNNVWVGTEECVTRIGLNGQSVKNYRFCDNLAGNVYSEMASMVLADGRIIMGTHNGLVVITPLPAHSPTGSPNVHLTDLEINGVSIYLSPMVAADAVERLANEDCIALPSTLNTLKFHFSDFNYAADRSSLFQYYLEGTDKDWLPATKSNTAEYRKLKPGHYLLHIKAIDNGIPTAERTVSVTIMSPWYATPWAWLCYVATGGSLAFVLFRAYNRNRKLRRQMAHEKELTELRISIFTHISQEFRTPLTIIQSAIGRICSPDGQKDARQNAQMANRGIRRLLKTLDMLMIFRKVQANTVEFKPKNCDIVAFVSDIVDDYRWIARKKSIMISFTPFSRQFITGFDPELVEVILYNILGNAVKYSPEKSDINMSLSKDGEWIRINCLDSGHGMTEEQAGQLFLTFMHGKASEGMGIGLYVSHRLAEIHKGDLTYSTPAEGGSLFTLHLPLMEAQSSNTAETLPVQTSLSATKAEKHVTGGIIGEAMNDEVVVVIEGDSDLAEQFQRDIGRYFVVKTFDSGEEACNELPSLKPAVVMTELQLPDSSGFDVVKKLRRTKELLGVPVIMLSASDEQGIAPKAYLQGVTDFIVKPCSTETLARKMSNLISLTQNARQENNGTFKPIINDDKDQRLKETLCRTIGQHMAEADFNVEKLAELMHMGKSKLNYKVKELYGTSPIKLIIDMRMKRACDMLSSTDTTIKEICKATGFNSIPYFTKCFHEHFQQTPMAYRNSHSAH